MYFDFVFDDVSYIIENFSIQEISSRHLQAIWANPRFGQYAPLHHSLLAAIYFFSGLDPIGYHIVQLLLHGACICLLYFVLKTVESARIALLASLLFAVFPPNIETVAWVSETKSTLAFIFFLISFLFFVRWRKDERWADVALCALFLVLSLLSKVSTIVAPAVFLLYDSQKERAWTRRRLATHACFFLISAAFAGITLFYSSHSMSASPDRLFDGAILANPSLQLDSSGRYLGSLQVRLLNLPEFLLFYIRMFLFPYPLSVWHMVTIYTELNWAIGAAWIGLLLMLWLLYRSPRPLQFWMLWFVAFLVPVLQLVPNPTWVADRYLYIPAVGGFILVAKLFFYLLDRSRLPWLRVGCQAALGAILLAFAWQTHQSLPAWRNNVVLWETATTTTCSQSAFCHSRWGKALFEEGQVVPAFREFFEAVRLRPSPPYLIYLGDAFMDGPGDYEQALRAYRAAREAAGSSLPSFVIAKIAKALYLAGNLKDAGLLLDAARKFDPDSTPLLLVDGFLQWKLGNYEIARARLRRILDLNSLYPRNANPAKFFIYYWRRPSEVGRVMADLGPF